MQKGGIIKMSESLKSLAEKTRKEHSSPEETNETPMVYEKEVTQETEPVSEEGDVIFGFDDDGANEDDTTNKPLTEEKLDDSELFNEFTLTDEELRSEMPDIDEESALNLYPKMREEIEAYRKNLIIHSGLTIEEANEAAMNRLRSRGKEENNAYLQEHPNVAVVEIDKKNADDVSFTPEEREKLTKVKVIELRVVEKKEVEAIKVKKVDKKKRAAILQGLDMNLSQYSVPLPILHDFVRFKGAQIIQMVQAVQYEDDKLEDIISKKASLLYTQLSGGTVLQKYSNEGKTIMSYNDFINVFPFYDLDMGLYGVLIASSMEEIETDLTCGSCNQPFTWKYNMKQLLSMDGFTEKFKETFNDILKNKNDVSFLQKGHEENFSVTQVTSPITHNIYEFVTPTIGKMIDLYKAINQEDKTILYLSTLVAFIHKLYVYNKAEDDHIEILEDEYNELFDVFQVLPQEELDIISKFLEPYVYEPTFILKSKCSKCGHNMENHLGIENLVFLKARNSRVETR